MAEAAAAEPARVLLDLNRAFLDSVAAESPPPALTARNLAVFHLAIHQSVVEAGKAGLAAPVAAAAAGNRVASSLFPGRAGNFSALEQASLTGGPATGKERQALELGWRVGDAWLERRKDDGSSTTIHYFPKEAPGQWRRTGAANRPPELPHWGKVTPFCLKSASQFPVPPPPALGSPAYREAWQQVERLGGATSDARTVDQTLAARYWSDFSYTPGPPGHWNEIAARMISTRHLDLAPAARLLARLNVAMADAGIVCWEVKYRCNFWRPVTAIQRADEDGDEATAPVPSWSPLLNTPPHPEYPSGHACFSGAAAAVLADAFPRLASPVATTSPSVPGGTRSFTSFDACAREIANSRVWGGIHFPTAGAAGLAVGEKIGRYCLGQPLPGASLPAVPATKPAVPGK